MIPTTVSHLETDGVPTPSYSQYPSELDKSWIHVTFFEDHPKLAGVISIYKNDKYPTGTVIFSKHILNEYPDMYMTLNKGGATYATTEKNVVLSDRIYTNPVYRRRGYWKWAGSMMRSILYSYNGLVLDGTDDRALAIEKIYVKAMKLGGQKKWFPNNGRMFNHKGWEKEPPREPAFPYIWYNQRLGGKNG